MVNHLDQKERPMPVLRPVDAVRHEAHGAAFHAVVAPSRGSAELCAWRLEVPPGQVGAPHRPSREEVLLVLDGDLVVTLDGEASAVGEGDVVLVPAGAELRVDGGVTVASVWVTTSPGLEAELADGSRLTPPWAR
jgi:quercetin dioxygenase-like cupin family protein